jgi:flagellar protein FliS
MVNRNAAAQYQSLAVQTAPGPQVLVMLYDRLSADIDVADRAIEARDYYLANESIQHAQQIVRVLRHSLQPDGFEGGHDLMALYDFLVRHLIDANLTKSREKLRECARIIEPLRDAWHLAVANPEGIDVPAHVG